MMEVLDLEVRIALVDELAEGDAVAAGRHIGDLGEAWLERRQALGRRLRARIFILGEDHATLVVDDRHDRAVEPSLLNGTRRTPLAFNSEGVECFAVDAFHRGNGIGAHTLIRLRMALLQPGIARAQTEGGEARRPLLLAYARNHRHHFGAAGDDE